MKKVISSDKFSEIKNAETVAKMADAMKNIKPEKVDMSGVELLLKENNKQLEKFSESIKSLKPNDNTDVILSQLKESNQQLLKAIESLKEKEEVKEEKKEYVFSVKYDILGKIQEVIAKQK
jgi:hypothetical protein